ncbi:hypothetical protein [Paenibacillus sp. FSL H8-0259]|uniref:hypothetical protein n=1 Tax=Paenibacillus sp. FSL H8-0259 TaxID=1920423 RepID=UPI00096CBB71|nr:hypothetical protein [Paenibacillus sp. FSL H8-0259]OMF30929.1 hypothetical protein BK132_05735 [Paenibacillus sp. FSL H8-0259]
MTQELPYAGLSGFLAPDGIFHSCGYQEHRHLAVELVKQYDVQFFDGDSNKVPNFIKFGCFPWVDKKGDSGCHAFGHDEPTPEQAAWLLANVDRMTDIQRRQILRDLVFWEIDISGVQP